MLQNINFQKKMFIFYSGFITILLLVLTLGLYLFMSQSIYLQSYKTMSQTANNISSLLDKSIEDIDRMSQQVSYNFEIQKILTKSFYSDMSNVIPQKDQVVVNGHVNYFDNSFQTETVSVKHILSPITLFMHISNKIILFDNNMNYVSSSIYPQNPTKFLDAITNNTWRGALEKAPNKFILLEPHEDWWFERTDNLVISLLRGLDSNFGSSAKRIGYVEVQLPYPKIDEICNINNLSNLTVIVLNQENKIIYPVNRYSDDEIAYYSTLKNQSGLIVKNPKDARNKLIYFKKSDYTNWYVIIAQPEIDFMSPVYILRMILLISGALFLILSLFIMHLLTRNLTSPIRELSSNLKKLSLENLSLNLSTQTNNELILFNDAFNKTLHKLKESMLQTIEARTSELRAHFLALQAQMNPHFMYNVLMVISSAGIELGSEKIVKMCSQLSEMMRYIASPDSKVFTILDEIEHTKNYLNLLKWRFQNHLQYTIDIDEKMYKIRVPKLILQPLAENSYNHGLSYKKPPWDISIRGWQELDRWFIEISDNGTGFTEEKLATLKLKVKGYKEQTKDGKVFSKLDIGGMGLSNIFYRLYMLYKDNTVFIIDCNEHGGTTVKIGGLIE